MLKGQGGLHRVDEAAQFVRAAGVLELAQRLGFAGGGTAVVVADRRFHGDRLFGDLHDLEDL